MSNQLSISPNAKEATQTMFDKGMFVDSVTGVHDVIEESNEVIQIAINESVEEIIKAFFVGMADAAGTPVGAFKNGGEWIDYIKSERTKLVEENKRLTELNEFIAKGSFEASQVMAKESSAVREENEKLKRGRAQDIAELDEMRQLADSLSKQVMSLTEQLEKTK